ncbi:MAG: autotransporter-associated beta strand repeat-containing protein, partial [Candidatus Didemnitutus sp.]|nr:autotransporter-associated beta strand repeat-containing protein [Candidatus Didemnitutus sp.]
LAGDGSFAKAGAGTLTLDGANTHTGGTTITAGTLLVGSNSALGTGTLTFNGGTLTSNAPRTFTNALALAANSTLGGTSALTFTGNGDLGSTTRTLTISNSALTTWSGALTGTAGLTKAGAGTLLLSGNNDYTGPTTISAGTLRAAANANALGAGALSLGAGTLELAHDTGLAFGRNTSITASTSITSDRFTEGAGVTHSLGTLTFSTTTTTLSILPGANVTSGLAGIAFDSVAFNAAAPTLFVDADTTATFGALSDNGTARAFTKSGQGTLFLAAAAGSLTTASSHTITGGTTRLLASDALGATARTNVVINATTADTTALFDLNNFDQAVLALTFGGATATASSTNQVTLGTGTLTLGGNVTFTATNNPLGASLLGGTINLGGATRTFSIADSTNAAVDLTVTSDLTGTGGLTKTGLGTLLLSGSNDYSGATLINTGTVRLGSANSLASNAVTINATTAGNTALLDLANFDATITTLTFGGTGGTTTSTSNLATGAGTLTLGGNVTYTATGNPLGSTLSGNLELAGVTRTFSIADSSNAAFDLTVSANIATSAGGISKTGTGTLLLSGNNQHTGGTTVTAGVLVLDHNNAAGTGTLTLGGGTFQGLDSALTLDNPISLTANTLISGTVSLDFTGNVSLGATTRTLTLANTASTHFSGVLSGTAGLTKAGTELLSLTGTSTYTGKTSVQNGTVVIGSLANLAAASALGAPTTSANGTIDLGSTTNTATLRYVGAGDSSNRVLNLAGTVGNAILDAYGTGALVLTSALTATGAGSKTLTLTGTNTNANTLAGAIINNSVSNLTSVEKSGTGTWELGGANTFTGGLTVTDGTLTIKAGASIAASNPVTVSGGVLNLRNTAQTFTSLEFTDGVIDLGSGHTLTLQESADATYVGLFSGDGGLTITSSGTYASISGSGSNSHSGVTRVSAGTLILAKSGGATAVSAGSILVEDTLRLGGTGQIGASVSLTLDGGTFQLNNFSANVGTLSLGANAVIDFGSGDAGLAIANSSAQTWSGTLTILNYSAGSNTLRFGTTSSGLTMSQLSQISFGGEIFGATIDSSGYVGAIPEPSTVALLAGIGALLLVGMRRRSLRSS